MKNFVAQAKLLRDDPRLGLSDEDKKTFERDSNDWQNYG